MLDAIVTVAIAVEAPEAGAELVAGLRSRLTRVADALLEQDHQVGASISRPRVLSLEGLCPPCVGGNWLPDLKHAAGCEDAFGDVGGSSAKLVSWEEIEAADPDVLVLSPCSASTQRTLGELHLLASQSLCCDAHLGITTVKVSCPNGHCTCDAHLGITTVKVRSGGQQMRLVRNG